MHERQQSQHAVGGRQMQKFWSRILAVVALSAMCNVLHATTPMTCAPPQQSETSAAAPAAQNSPSASEDKLSLSDQIIQDVLEPLRTGVETQNIRQILSVFDRHEFSGYGDLQQDLRAFFRQYDEVNFRYQILQAAIEKDHASATAEIDMDAMPYTVTQVPARRSVQMRFQLKQQGENWKVVGFSPANFFGVNWSQQK